MEDLFAWAEAVLSAPAVQDKLDLTQEAARALGAGRLPLARVGEPLPIASACFPEKPSRVNPRELPRRRLNSLEGRIALLHAVAHIEFTAIQLAWDHLYRFRGLPEAYYRDWLGVAEEEARHFQLLRERLRALGADYGDLPAHGGLWDLAVETAYDVAARMALVPRFMEARGLDVTPGMIEKLRETGDMESVAALEIILRDEVRHVALGTQWFHWICAQRGIEPEDTYFGLIDRHMKGQARGPFNTDLRRRAGFSEQELARLDPGQLSPT
ncbi:ferritin-like domain-containing protein [Methyloterricola oryzae]|uniref:ferritin-like domain-containing protein n=1 Tax=Methyloterricola oryzae TaxID=1495050 RepID=UPI0005EBA9E6|nr:ferritin-like domain-containing protein [Methyloterricola oryzae]